MSSLDFSSWDRRANTTMQQSLVDERNPPGSSGEEKVLPTGHLALSAVDEMYIKSSVATDLYIVNGTGSGTALGSDFVQLTFVSGKVNTLEIKAVPTTAITLN